MRSAARAALLGLAAALAGAAQLAAVHPIEHVDEAGRFVHLAGGDRSHERDEGGTGLPCDAIASVSACMDAGALALAAPAGTAAPGRTPSAASRRGAPTAAYRSQAPPALS